MFFLQLDYCKSNVIDHFSCDYFPLLYLSCSDTKFLEILGFSCAVYSTVHFSINNSVLHIYHQNNFEDPFYHSEDKGLFHVFVPHDCHLHLLWQLHFHVCESICKRQGLFEQGSGYANTSVAPMLNPFIYTLRNQQVKRAFMGMARKIMFFLKEMKI